MESFTDTDGVPVAANKELLDYLLRYRLGFNGVVVTDYLEVQNLEWWHHVVPSVYAAVVQSVQEAGIDVSMSPQQQVEGFLAATTNAVERNDISIERIRQAAERVLRLKSELGMFQERMTMTDPNLDLVGTDDDAVLPMVQDSLILAKNDNVLPLDGEQPLQVHVTGPTAHSLARQTGGWTFNAAGASNDDEFRTGVSVLQAFQALQAWSVTYDCGVDVHGNECENPGWGIDQTVVDEFQSWTGLTPTTSMARSVKASETADWTVICVGEDPYYERSGEIRSLRLPRGQSDLVQAIRRHTKTKILLIYFGGRARLLTDMVDHADAVILGFLPGPNAGQAILDVVTGRVNPSGRLPITYPSEEDGGGVPYWHAVTNQCTESSWYVTPCAVQWPFGHGLSYTSFAYSKLWAEGGIDIDLHVSVTVTNTGNRSGADTVMFFTFDMYRETVPEFKRLRAFEKVMLDPGQSAVVKLTVPVEELKFVGQNDDRHYVLDPHMTAYLGVGYTTDCRRNALRSRSTHDGVPGCGVHDRLSSQRGQDE
jgi:beta-glucosidase